MPKNVHELRSFGKKVDNKFLFEMYIHIYIYIIYSHKIIIV